MSDNEMSEKERRKNMVSDIKGWRNTAGPMKLIFITFVQRSKDVKMVLPRNFF